MCTGPVLQVNIHLLFMQVASNYGKSDEMFFVYNLQFIEHIRCITVKILYAS